MAKILTAKDGYVSVSTPAGKIRIPVGTKFNVIPTHPRPHHDEMVATWMLIHYGEGIFPGISEAAIDYFPDRKLPEGCKNVRDLLAKGIIPPVGMLETLFDEHPLNREAHTIATHHKGDAVTVVEECATSLVAQLLGIRDRGEFQRLINFVRRTDLRAAAHPFDISNLVKVAHWKDGTEIGQEQTIGDVFLATDAFCRYERFRLAELPNAYEAYLAKQPKTPMTLEEFADRYEGDLDAAHIADIFDCLMHAWIAKRFCGGEKPTLQPVEYFFQFMPQLRAIKRISASKLQPILNDPAMKYIKGYWEKLRVNNVRQGLAALTATILWSGSVSDPVGDPAWAIDFMFKYLDACYDRQHHFLNETAAEFREKAKVEKIAINPGVFVTLVSIESDDELMGTYARSDLGANADIVIQRMPKTGHVAITTNTVKKHKRREMADVVIRMDDIAAVMRYEEQRCNGKLVADRFSDLLRDGTLEEVPEWFFFGKAMAIFNGSLTAPTVPATKIPFGQIVFMVKNVLNQTFFANKFKTTCVKGVCKATQENPCPIYGWGLWRCRNIRAVRHEANKRQNDAPPQLVQITLKTSENVEA